MPQLGATHYAVLDPVRRYANDVAERFNCSWNTYYDHPSGYHLDDVSVDFWAPGGRGARLNESTGDEVAAWVLGQHQVFPVAWLIWFSWWWRPKIGWARYSGWSGTHHDHVHVTFARYSNTADTWPSP